MYFTDPQSSGWKLILIRTDSNIRTVWNSKYILTDIFQNKVVISDAFQQNQMNSWIWKLDLILYSLQLENFEINEIGAYSDILLLEQTLMSTYDMSIHLGICHYGVSWFSRISCEYYDLTISARLWSKTFLGTFCSWKFCFCVTPSLL